MSRIMNRDRADGPGRRGRTGNSGRLARFAVASLALTALAVSGATTVDAAPIDVTDVALVVTPSTVNSVSDTPVQTEFSGCVPNTAAQGDTIQLVLPEQVTRWPSGFDVDDSDASGATTTAFRVTISTDEPAVATFTLTAEGAAINNLCFTSNFGGRYADDETGTSTLTYLVGGVTFSPSVDVVDTVRGSRPRTEPTKRGFFTSGDQCRNTTENCLVWYFETPIGDNGEIVIVDPARSGWIYDCDNINHRIRTFATPSERGSVVESTPVSEEGPVSWTCSADEVTFTLDTTVLDADQSLRVDIGADAAAPSGMGGISYDNEAVYTVAGSSMSFATALTSAFVGGVASGDAVSIEKTDAAGNDADTAADAVEFVGRTSLLLTITNSGDTALTDVVVSDDVISGGTVTGLDCAFPNETNGTTWAGPFETGARFECSATLDGVTSPHQNTATVTATGNNDVSDSDDFFANPPPPPPPLPLLTPSVSVGDFVFIDENGDGIQDDGDTPVRGATLTLTGPNGQPVTDVDGVAVGTRTTGPDGLYSFDALPVLAIGESYTVTIDPSTASTLAGSLPTLTGEGSSSTDSSTGSAASTGLTSGGDRDPTLDFGFRRSDLTQVTFPSIGIEKYSGTFPAGDFDVASDTLVAGIATTITFTITNTGDEVLETIVVSDTTNSGDPLTGISCAFPGGSTGTTWAGPFAAGASFDCSGTLAPQRAGDAHADTAGVTGIGVVSEVSVSDTDPYNALVPAPIPTLPATGVEIMRTVVISLILLLVGGMMLLTGTKGRRRPLN